MTNEELAEKKIRIVGYESLGLLLYNNFKKDVVKIGTKYYMKNSPLLCVINGKHYRKESPLVAQDDFGRYYLKKDEGKLYVSLEGVRSYDKYNLQSSDLGLTAFPVNISLKDSLGRETTIATVSIFDERLSLVCKSDIGYIHTSLYPIDKKNNTLVKVKKSDVVSLNQSSRDDEDGDNHTDYEDILFKTGRISEDYWFGARFTFNGKSNSPVRHAQQRLKELSESEEVYLGEGFVEIRGKFYIEERLVFGITDETSLLSKIDFFNTADVKEDDDYIGKKILAKKNKNSVLVEKDLKVLCYSYDFRKNTSQWIKYCLVPSDLIKKYRNSLFYSLDLGCYFFVEDKSKVKEEIENLSKICLLKIKPFKSFLEKKYDKDILEKNEHLPIFANFTTGRVSGGNTYYSPSYKKDYSSISKSRVGNINYTFGIEFETSFGEPPTYMLDQHTFKKVGDASMYDEELNLMSYEFVSSVLHGNKGLKNALSFIDKLKRYCAVSNKCAVHIHVGGSDKANTPSFNKQFAHAAIKLGTKLEEELFSLLPARRRNNKYCQSIMSYKGISKDNLNEMIAAYVFDKGVLNRDYNKHTQLGRWTPSRYKWLNIVNFMSDNNSHGSREGGFKTIEFRAFHSTYEQSYILFSILFSLAFVWYIENRVASSISNNPISLMEMFNEAIRGREREEILSFLESFINEKKQLCAV